MAGSKQTRDFVYSALPARVIFASGAFQRIPEEVRRLGARRALVICTPQQTEQAEAASALLGSLSAGVFAGAQMHVPIETAREARRHAQEAGADCVVAVGGGSTIGMGKAIALESALPILAVPTTYAGSEMTPIYGITEGGLKKTGRDAKVLPRTVIYDPDLTMSLPLQMSVVSGINAIAHAAEGMYAQDGNPIMSAHAEEGIRSLSRGLRGLMEDAGDTTARGECLYGAWLCGTVLGHVGVALHHKLCHTLGGSFNLPHAETHTAVLPHALAYNSAAAPLAMNRIAAALGARTAAAGVYDLAKQLGAPLSLRDLGLAEADLDKACAIVLSNPYWNPRPIESEGLRALLYDAWAGNRPGA